ncbi:5-(carboxyamino)imidazole ribonucleotide synthase [Ovoidimarina sediminis]|uniref:5-(carboxyamino)imidazole ribonucleotide synthase n=1 Tax=Ovoidimarina sediminis TaxID=3079856 RepID=UPI002915B3D6|nr:5-(carboxyamino)imidazole ribonucleotide synthase [Rhodophyticola sp. MJ-SS7]MDU8944736.1 5-(carboxyamino)imidazole ribonucleotide synthase [Rhodophyticola sp. MJ-SS7]
MTDALPTGATIGILGGGQLGRMLSLSAARLGLKCHIFEPAANCPASQVSAVVTTASYDDHQALIAFADAVDVVTYEFENVPAEALDVIEARVPIRPGRNALAISQDRLTEKDFLSDVGLFTAPYAVADTMGDLAAALAITGTPAILKTRRFGYDGKGQTLIDDPAKAEEAHRALNGAPAILEGVVSFEREISVIAARSLDGTVVAFDPGENVHRDGILRTTVVPGEITAPAAFEAVSMTTRLLEALDYVGVIGVELFQHSDGLIVNEFAPRVHNSGHWTQNGCLIDQFEQHIRAVAGWPLGDGKRHSDIEMENLIGHDMDKVAELAGTGAALHLYGKAETREGRKMGHVNRITGPAV